MKGGGECVFETDFPPCSDRMGQIMNGRRGGERIGFERFTRVNAQKPPLEVAIGFLVRCT